MNAFLNDLKTAARSLRRAPAFVALATLSLGTGLGLSTAVFALIDAVTHPTPPYRDVDQLFEVIVGGRAKQRPPVEEIAAGLRGIPGVSQVINYGLRLQTQKVTSVSRIGPVAYVRASYFSVLGVKPYLGRLIAEQEPQRVALVPFETWRSEFGNRQSLSGATIEIDGNLIPIVGVMPRFTAGRAAVWLSAQTGEDYGGVIVRLEQGTSIQVEQERFSAFAKQLTTRYARADEFPFFARLNTMRPDPLTVRDFHKAMIAGALCVLLIGCANVAALMLARGLGRSRDYAVRLAIGASRTTIARGVLSEVTLLAVAGGIAGAMIASWSTSLMTGYMPSGMRYLGFDAPQWSVRVFIWSALAVIVTIIIAAGYPAWSASRVDPAGPLKDGGGGQTGRVTTRFRWLVIAELSVAMTLLVTTSLMLKSAYLMAHTNLGYDPRLVYHVSVDRWRMSREDMPVTATDFDRVLREVRQRLSAVPGVVAIARRDRCVVDKRLVTTDRTIAGGLPGYFHECSEVSPGFFGAMGMRLRAGRDILEGDQIGGGTAVIDERGARILFPHESAIGRQVKVGPLNSPDTWHRIVGIAPVQRGGSDPSLEAANDSSFALYVSQSTDSARASLIQSTFVVRVTTADPSLPVALNRAVSAGLPPHVHTGVLPAAARFYEDLRLTRYLAAIFAALGLASLGLATAGLFSVVSYASGLRMREFAVRVALGASSGEVGKLVLRDTLIMSLGGTAIGAALGMWSGFLMWDRMWGVYPVDVGALVAAEVVLLLTTVLAALPPVRRAMSVDPVALLRAS
jgi:putative ABC transport system permease protein